MRAAGLQLVLLSACAAEPAEKADEEAPWFTEAVLDPPFEHKRSVWAGVALLDYDLDGWTDLFFTNGKGQPDSLYRNMGDGTFVDMAEEAGIDEVMESGSVVAGDLDDDGDTDLVVSASCSTGSFDEDGGPWFDGDKVVYLNQGDGTFAHGDFTEEQPLADTEEVAGQPVKPIEVAVGAFCTVSMHLVDVDQDGDLDLMLGNSVDPDLVAPWVFRKVDGLAIDWVLLNDGSGNFAEPSQVSGSMSTTFAMTSLDLDGDGQIETLAGRAGYAVQRTSWAAGPEGSTTNETTLAGLWMGLAPADYDNDGDLDLYATNQGLSALIQGYDNTASAVLENGVEAWLYHAVFENVDGALELGDWPVEASGQLAGDVFDGLEGEREDLMNPEGIERYSWGWGAVALDFDADGYLDVATTHNACAAPMEIIWSEDRGAGPGSLLRNTGEGGFVDVTGEAGVANVDSAGRYQDGRGLAVGDLDRDGYPDLVYANKTYNPTQSDPLAQEVGTPHVWLSAGARENNWLQVHLVGTSSPRDPFGATVLVTDSRGTTAHAYGAGGGTSSSSEALLMLGLGKDDAVDIEVRFPSGAVVTLAGVEANQRIEISEE